MITDNFQNWLSTEIAETPAERIFPMVFDDHDGDRVEFFLTDEDRIAERVDARLTIYRGRETGEIVGGAIKGLRNLHQRLSVEFDAFAFFIKEGRINLSFIFAAEMLKQSNEVLAMHYQSVFEKLSLTKIEVPVSDENGSKSQTDELCEA